MHTSGAVGVDPVTGAQLWQCDWHTDGIVQPAVLPDGDIVLRSGSGMGGGEIGVRRIALTHGSGGWSAEERWTSIGLKPHFNDFVIHAGHAYGFDGGHLACIDLADGEKKWKGGRYGHGQMILIADSDVLLVVSEKGELALVAATPAEHRELARVPALEGKTWNHPVMVGDVLLVRNDHEMAAWRVGVAGR
jgi:outer membrane protein assembly factor BamB